MNVTRKAMLTAVVGLTLAVVAAACGSEVADEESSRNAVPTVAVALQTAVPEDTPSPVMTEGAEETVEATETAETAAMAGEAIPEAASSDVTDSPESATSGDVDSVAALLAGLEWTSEDVDEGIKPAIALTADGTVYIAYMSEDAMGFVRAAVRTDEGFEITTVAEGYYYGPLDLAIGPDDAAHIAWHDHQALGFDPEKGDDA